jgi:dTDP-4-amino-4,6-dideoxygalactose transaminase
MAVGALMRETALAFAPPFIGEDEINEVVAALRSDWLTCGPRTSEFTRAFAAFVDAPAALAVNSGTAAMHVALAALGIGPGDAVVTTPMTFCSTVHVIEQVGALPVFADIEADTLNIDAEEVARALKALKGDRTTCRALLPVHYGGQACDLATLLSLAEEYDVAVVEDAAHALPAWYGERMIGALGDSSVRRAVAFSFYATKPVTTGEGGMLVGDEDLIAEAEMWSLHGMARDAWTRYGTGSWYYEVVRPGFKYNMTDVQAAIGIHQLRKADFFHTRRATIADRYNESLAKFDALEVPTARTGRTHAWHLYGLRLNLDRLTVDRDRFIEELAQRNISTSVHFIPVHQHPYYRDRYGYAPDDFPVAAREFERLVSLPIYPRMTNDDVDDVIEAVTDVATIYRR